MKRSLLCKVLHYRDKYYLYLYNSPSAQSRFLALASLLLVNRRKILSKKTVDDDVGDDDDACSLISTQRYLQLVSNPNRNTRCFYSLINITNSQFILLQR